VTFFWYFIFASPGLQGNSVSQPIQVIVSYFIGYVSWSAKCLDADVMKAGKSTIIEGQISCLSASLPFCLSGEAWAMNAQKVEMNKNKLCSTSGCALFGFSENAEQQLSQMSSLTGDH
jgi:hypothetical protein